MFRRLIIAALPAILIAGAVQAQTIKTIRRASLAPGTNAQGESFSYDPKIDGAGKLITFTSASDNFAAPGNVPGLFHEHAYLRNIDGNSTSQLDVTADGRTGSPSAAFLPDIRVFRSSFNTHISRDGQYAVFQTSQNDLAPESSPADFGQWAYLKNLSTGEIHRIPHVYEGDLSKSEYPAYLAINADGSIVVISSIMSDISDETCANCPWELTVFDRNLGTTRLLDTGVAGNKFNVELSDDGRFLVFENQLGDFSTPRYSYLFDLLLNELTPLNNGNPAISPAISGNGEYIAYSDNLTYPSRIRLRERQTGLETLVSGGLNGAEPNGTSEFASLSQDGRYVAFLSNSDNLVTKDLNGSDDIFVFDRVTGKTVLVSVQGVCTGVVTNEGFNTGPPSISSDGTTIVFAVLERLLPADLKDSSNNFIEPADTNRFDDVYYVTLDYSDQPDVFKKSLKPPAPLVSVNCTGEQANIRVEEILSKASPGVNTIKPGKSIKSVTQRIVIQRVDSGAGKKEYISKVTTRRNDVTSKNLPPGNYTARVGAEARYKDGTIVKSRLSPPSSFKITQ